MICSSCNTNIAFPLSSEKFLGTCRDCRFKTHNLCYGCLSYAIPVGGKSCIACANTGVIGRGIGSATSITAGAKVKYPSLDAKATSDLYDEITKMYPKKKEYGDQCPCGIHPSRCSYHS